MINAKLLEKYWKEFVGLKTPYNTNRTKEYIFEFVSFVLYKLKKV